MRRIYIYPLLVVVAVCLGYLLLVSPIGREGLRRIVVSQIQKRLNGRAGIDRLGGDLLGEAELRGLTLIPQGEEKPALSVGRLSVHYSLWGLIWGDFPLHSVEVEGVTLSVQTRGERTNWEGLLRESEEPDGHAEPGDLMRWVPGSVRIRDVQLLQMYGTDTLWVQCDSLRLDAEREALEGLVEVALKAGPVGIRRNQEAVEPFGIIGNVRLGTDEVEVQRLAVEGPGLAARLWGRYTDREFGVKLDMGGAMAGLGSLFPRLGGLEGDMAMHATAEGDSAAVRAALSLALRRVRTTYADLDTVDVQLSYTMGRVGLDDLLVEMGQGKLTGEGSVELDAPGRPCDLQLSVQEINLERLGAFFEDKTRPLRGTVWGGLSVRGPLENPASLEGSVDLRSKDLALGSEPVGEAVLKVVYRSSQINASLQGAVGEFQLRGALGLSSIAQLGLEGRHDLRGLVSAKNLDRLGRLAGLTGLKGSASVEVRSRGALRKPELRATVRGEEIAYAPLRLGRLAASAELDTTGALRAEVRGGRGKLQLDVQGAMPRGEIQEGRLLLRDAMIPEFLEPDLQPLLDGSLEVDLSFAGTIREPRIRGNISMEDLTYEGQGFGDVRWDLSLLGRKGTFRMVGLDSAAMFEGTLELKEDLPFSLQGIVRNADLAPFLFIAGGQGFSYTGRLSGGLEAEGPLKRPEEIRAILDLEEVRVASGEGELHLTRPAQVRLEGGAASVQGLQISGSEGTITAEGRVVNRGALDLTVGLEDFQLAFVGPFLVGGKPISGSLDATFQLGGTARAPTMEGYLAVPHFRYAGVSLGNFRADFSYMERLFRMSELTLDLPKGRVRGQAAVPINLALQDRRGPSEEETFDLKIWIEGVEVDSTLRLPAGVYTRADGGVHLHGPLQRPDRIAGEIRFGRLEAQSRGFRFYNSEPVALRLDANGVDLVSLKFKASDTAGAGGPAADAGRVEVTGKVVRKGNSTLRVAMSDLDLKALGKLAGLTADLGGTFEADFGVRGTMDRPRLAGRWQLTDGRVDSLRVREFRGTTSYEGKGLRIGDVRLELGGGWVETEAVLPVNLGPDRTGSVWRADGPIDIVVRADSIDLSAFQELSLQIEEMAGRLDMDFKVGGTPSTLRPEGSLRIRDGRLKLYELEPELVFSQGVVTVQDGRLVLSGFEGSSRKGTWKLSGEARLDGVLPDTFEVALSLRDMELRIPETMTLTTDGDLRWAGTPGTSRLSGGLRVPKGRITKPLSLSSLLFQETPPPPPPAPFLDRIALDVKVDLDQARLKNNLADVGLRGDLVLTGTVGRPIINGNIAGTKGYVLYLDRRFELDRTSVLFDSPYPLDSIFSLFYDPQQLDPQLDIAAHSELTATDGNDYRIDLSLSESLSELQFDLVSDPPMNKVEILSLLNFGDPAVLMLDAGDVLLDRAANLSARYLMQATATQFQRVLGLERIQIDANVFKPQELAGTRITVTKKLNGRTEVTYSTAVGHAAEGRVELHYKLTEHLFVKTERDALGESGVDLKLRLRFR